VDLEEMYNIRGERIDVAEATDEDIGDIIEALYSEYGDSDNIESIIQELLQRREES
tara:strand:+ start:185 stop:352 length:168 start_codon:yes stop_codon:yes gene_type:complete